MKIQRNYRVLQREETGFMPTESMSTSTTTSIVLHHQIDSTPQPDRSSMIARSSKRQRRTIAAAASSSSSAEPDDDASSSPWASLQGDLVQLIGWRLLEDTAGGDLLDYVRLRAVCAHWRSSTVSPHIADARFHPRRWMMLPEGHGLHPGHGKLRGYVRFVSLSTGAIVRARLPLFTHHCVLDSADGLLLLQRDGDTAVRLLHPFTGNVAELPPLLTLVRRHWPDHPPDAGDRETRNVWFKYRELGSTCVSVGADGVITVMAVVTRMNLLAFASTVDRQWTFVADLTVLHVHRPLSFRGKLYMLDYCSETTRIIEIEPPRPGSASSPVPLPPPKLVAKLPPSEPRSRVYYLAECDAEILLLDIGGDPLYSRLTVYRVADLVTQGRLVPATSIGDNVVMVCERVLSVSSRVLPNVEGDSVVMAHGDGEYPFFAQYQLGSAACWSLAADERKLHGVPSPCCLIYHIFTCCRPGLWNKGEICFQGKRGNHCWKVKRKWRHGA